MGFGDQTDNQTDGRSKTMENFKKIIDQLNEGSYAQKEEARDQQFDRLLEVLERGIITEDEFLHACETGGLLPSGLYGLVQARQKAKDEAIAKEQPPYYDPSANIVTKEDLARLLARLRELSGRGKKSESAGSDVPTEGDTEVTT